MKTVIKYELTINKAMRSALSYGTPDEQIDEFIRYLGRHIGADRIYIFEDCPKKNITKNNIYIIIFLDIPFILTTRINENKIIAANNVLKPKRRITNADNTIKIIYILFL